jgi:hypothetical protein
MNGVLHYLLFCSVMILDFRICSRRREGWIRTGREYAHVFACSPTCCIYVLTFTYVRVFLFCMALMGRKMDNLVIAFDGRRAVLLSCLSYFLITGVLFCLVRAGIRCSRWLNMWFSQSTLFLFFSLHFFSFPS